MSFATRWLDLREAADRAARDSALLQKARGIAASRPEPVIVDLGAGTGATMRTMGPVAGARWRLVDHDPRLLSEARQRALGETALREMDMADVDALPLEGAALVTASAFFDLAGAQWMTRLADRLAEERLPLYAALTYDGRHEFTPPLEEDAAVTAAFNAHQRGEKGLGPALGPGAAGFLKSLLEARGYDVTVAASPWRLAPQDAALQRALIEGIAEAAGQAGEPAAAGWLLRRLDALETGICLVGHLDLIALPPHFSAQSTTMSVPSP